MNRLTEGFYLAQRRFTGLEGYDMFSSCEDFAQYMRESIYYGDGTEQWLSDLKDDMDNDINGLPKALLFDTEYEVLLPVNTVGDWLDFTQVGEDRADEIRSFLESVSFQN